MDLKRCRACGKPMERKRWENKNKYAERAHCNQSCAGETRRRQRIEGVQVEMQRVLGFESTIPVTSGTEGRLEYR